MSTKANRLNGIHEKWYCRWPAQQKALFHFPLVDIWNSIEYPMCWCGLFHRKTTGGSRCLMLGPDHVHYLERLQSKDSLGVAMVFSCPSSKKSLLPCRYASYMKHWLVQQFGSSYSNTQAYRRIHVYLSTTQAPIGQAALIRLQWFMMEAIRKTIQKGKPPRLAGPTTKGPMGGMNS